MNVELGGRVLIVTGGSQGIGEAIARRAAEAGAEGLLITALDGPEGHKVAADISRKGTPCTFFPADLLEVDAEETIFSAALNTFGKVDGLVNAAGLTDRGSAEDATPDLWRRLFRANAEAPFFLTQKLIRHLKERGAEGSVVNILSINVHIGLDTLAVYSASKAALALLTKNTAHAHRYDRIRVNGINLGWADTPGEHKMQIETLGMGADWYAEQKEAQPFGRLVEPDDVGRLAVFLLSDASRPMTGSVIDQEQHVIGGNR